jgi:hypothetical protein
MSTPPTHKQNSSNLLCSPEGRNSSVLLCSPERAVKTSMATEMKEKLRKQFMIEAFGIQYNDGLPSTPQVAKTSKLLTKAQFDQRIDFMEKWAVSTKNKTEKVAKSEFQQANRQGFRWAKEFKVVVNNDGSKELKRLPTPAATFRKNPWAMHDRNVAHVDIVFDIIYSLHNTLHLKSAKLFNSIRNSWSNVPQGLCDLYIKLCPICAVDHPKIKPVKGCAQPIRSFQYRDRMQADLVDMRNAPALYDPDDPSSPICYWLLVVKDHFSRFVILRPIISKEARSVARELDFFFSMIGYPMIFQTDNGGEFIGEEIYRILLELNPECAMLHGRPRTPQDQGSVERANQAIKSILARMVMSLRLVEHDHEKKRKITWVTCCPGAMRAMNSTFSSGSGEIEPYRLAFGMDYHEPLFSGIVHEMQNNPTLVPTVEDRVKRLGHDFQDKLFYMGEYGEGSVDMLAATKDPHHFQIAHYIGPSNINYDDIGSDFLQGLSSSRDYSRNLSRELAAAIASKTCAPVTGGKIPASPSNEKRPRERSSAEKSVDPSSLPDPSSFKKMKSSSPKETPAANSLQRHEDLTKKRPTGQSPDSSLFSAYERNKDSAKPKSGERSSSQHDSSGSKTNNAVSEDPSHAADVSNLGPPPHYKNPPPRGT